jgi:hypothetical protein
MIDYMIMSLSKLTDKARMCGNDNLSYHYLIESLRKIDSEGISDQLQSELDELAVACETFREIRNKRVAHNDLVVALGERGSPLPGVSREDIETALRHARNIMNRVELHYYNSQTLYDEFIIPLTNDGRSVLIWLQKGLMYDRLEDDGVVERGRWRELGDLDS